MSLNTFTGGVNEDFSTELNANFNASKLQVVYTGVGFDSSQSGAGTDSDDHELTSISSANLGGADYLVISITGASSLNLGATSAASTSTQIQIETKDIGGSYSDSLSNSTVFSTSIEQSRGISERGTISWVHTLTNDEKSAGVQVKITSRSIVPSGGNSASYSNTQVVIRTSG